MRHHASPARRSSAARNTLLGLTVIGALGLTACSTSAEADDERPIRFGTVQVVEDPGAESPIDAIKELLEAETGRPVEIVDVPDYLSVVEAVRAGHMDIALMSAFPTALAYNTGEVDVLAAWPGSEDPVSTCYVLEDSPIQSIEELEGKTIALADPGSTSGFFMPVHMLDAAGLTKDEDYEILFSGGHDRSAIAVKEGQVDAACTATLLSTMTGSDYFPFEEGEVRFLGESIAMPVGIGILSNQDLDQETRDLIAKALPAVFSEENADRLDVYASAGILGVDPVIDPSADMFAPLVEVADLAGVDISDLE